MLRGRLALRAVCVLIAYSCSICSRTLKDGARQGESCFDSKMARTVGRSSGLPGPTVLEADLHAAVQKIIEYIKIEEHSPSRCDGAMVARQIADLEAASSSLAHSSVDSGFFFFFRYTKAWAKSGYRTLIFTALRSQRPRSEMTTA